MLTFSAQDLSKTNDSQKPSDLPETRLGCSGCVEALASDRRSLPYAQDSKVAILGSFFESFPNQGLKPPRPKRLLDLSPFKEVVLRGSEESNGASLEKQYAIGAQMKTVPQVHENGPDPEVLSQSPTRKSLVHTSEPKCNSVTEHIIYKPECDDTFRGEPLVKHAEKLPDSPINSSKALPVSSGIVLSVRTRSQSLGRKTMQVGTQPIRVGKRMTDRENEDLEAVVSRKPKRRFKTITPIQSITVVSHTPTPSRSWESSEQQNPQAPNLTLM